MDGIINVLKPPGMTSSDVVVRLRRMLKTKKVGHTGTLDIGAAGVLPICVGKGTRLAEFITEQGKTYLAEVTFGITTDTQDAFGKELCRTTPEVEQGDLERVRLGFLGKIRQTPPMYSAVRQGGKHLYEYARQGVTVERSSREISIYHLEVLKWYNETYPRARLRISCSKGTYIRSICHELGQALGCGAHMSYLLRVCSGLFPIAKSWTLEEIAKAIEKSADDFLLPLTAGIEFPRVVLSDARAKAFRNGLPTESKFVQILPSKGEFAETREQSFCWSQEGQKTKYVQVMENETLLGIGVWREEGLFPHKVLG